MELKRVTKNGESSERLMKSSCCVYKQVKKDFPFMEMAGWFDGNILVGKIFDMINGCVRDERTSYP